MTDKGGVERELNGNTWGIPNKRANNTTSASVNSFHLADVVKEVKDSLLQDNQPKQDQWQEDNKIEEVVILLGFIEGLGEIPEVEMELQ